MTGKTETGASAGGDNLREELAAELARDSENNDGPAPESAPEPESGAAEGVAQDTGQGESQHDPASEDANVTRASNPASKDASGEPAGPNAENGTPQSEDASGIPTSGPTSGAPQSFSAEARAEWDSVPDAVKQAVLKREREVDQGFRRYAGLGQFMKLAHSAGTSLPDALTRYVAAERMLDADPVSGILALCRNYNVDPSALVVPSSTDASIPNASQTNNPAPASGPARDLADKLAPLEAEMRALQDLVLSNQQAHALEHVEKFFNDEQAHPYIAEVAPDMARLLDAGLSQSLQQAYDAACWNNEEVRGRLINAITTARAREDAARARAAADQARAAGRSITGGPAATPPPGPPESDDLREQLKAAFASAKLA